MIRRARSWLNPVEQPSHRDRIFGALRLGGTPHVLRPTRPAHPEITGLTVRTEAMIGHVTLTIAEVAGPREPDFDSFVDVCVGVEKELSPDDPPLTPAEIEADYFRPSAHRELRSWLAHRDGRPVGAITIEIPHDANRDELRPDIWVVSDQRRQGIATELLRTGLHPVAEGRSRLGLWVETDAAGAFCRSLGLDHRQVERCSRLSVSDIDHRELQRWVEQAPARSEGYRLVSWQGPCPDEHMDAFCVAYDAMADIPLDDVEHRHTPLTPRDIRDKERAMADSRTPIVSLVLAPDGAAAGLTVLWANHSRPFLAEQDDTGVLPDHRGRGIGRWLKAANLSQTLADHTELRVIETYNAESNPWMLAINVDMGFRPHKAYHAYQGPLPEQLLDGRA